MKRVLRPRVPGGLARDTWIACGGLRRESHVSVRQVGSVASNHQRCDRQRRLDAHDRFDVRAVGGRQRRAGPVVAARKRARHPHRVERLRGIDRGLHPSGVHDRRLRWPSLCLSMSWLGIQHQRFGAEWSSSVTASSIHGPVREQCPHNWLSAERTCDGQQIDFRYCTNRRDGRTARRSAVNLARRRRRPSLARLSRRCADHLPADCGRQLRDPNDVDRRQRRASVPPRPESLQQHRDAYGPGTASLIPLTNHGVHLEK